MSPARKRKSIEAGDGSYGGMVLAAFEALQNGASSVQGRDPRHSPLPGDRVTVGSETREVEKVIGDRVIYSWPGKVAVRSIGLVAWRAWAEDAISWSTAP